MRPLSQQEWSRPPEPTSSHRFSAGIGALSGPLHGGANAQVMRNLIDTNDIEKVESWVLEQFKNGKRVSGMGHAVYKTIDPRAVILQNMAKELLKDHPEYRWVALTDKMAEATQKYFKKNKRRDIYPNVDLYSASIYHAMGIYFDLYPPVFAMARSSGWAAHILEQKYPIAPMKPILYRPSCTYVGDIDRPYISIEERTCRSLDGRQDRTTVGLHGRQRAPWRACHASVSYLAISGGTSCFIRSACVASEDARSGPPSRSVSSGRSERPFLQS